MHVQRGEAVGTQEEIKQFIMLSSQMPTQSHDDGRVEIMLGLPQKKRRFLVFGGPPPVERL